MVTDTQIEPLVSPDTLLPDLLREHPEARPVFDRYGLSGCGGPLGPVESIRFFARAHGVDEAQLLSEIAQAARQKGESHDPVQAIPLPIKVERADTIYRRFFVGGILLILTAGATWGAWLLWKIGFSGAFTGISIHDVNAHGHAQIFGWVGLFIMGFAYQAFPRIWHTRLAAPILAAAVFVLMAAGLIVCTLGMTLAGSWRYAVPAAMIGGGMELLGVCIFAGQIVTTYRRSDARMEPYIGFILVAIGWFVAMTGMNVWHTWNTMTAPASEQLLYYVKTYQAPLRDLQIHGLALFMILGVGQRMLPGLFDVPRINDRRAWWALAVLTFGVIGEVALFVAYGWTGNHVLAATLMIPWIMLASGIVMVAWPWKLWRPFATPDRSAKFVRMAYAWLAVSMIMLLLLPVYQYLSGIVFSHAYYGSVRHAITVGFISLMIMGFAAKVVPTLNGVDPRQLSALWGPFILVNLGCFLRVSTQTLTDWYPGFFAVIGMSGTLEVAGLAWWGIGLIQIIRRGRAAMQSDVVSGPRPARIEGHHRVAEVLDWFPQTEPVFISMGYSALRNPVLRRTVARQVTIAQASTLHHMPPERLLEALNAVIVTRGVTESCSCCEAPAERYYSLEGPQINRPVGS